MPLDRGVPVWSGCQCSFIITNSATYVNMAATEASPHNLSLLGISSVSLGLLAPVVLAIIYYGAIAIYNIWLHPLAKYPGPRLAAASPLWMISSYFYGRTPSDLHKLHERYGPVVRTSPNELSYINSIQWKEIYGYKPRGDAEFAKDPKYFSGLKGEPILFTADRDYHGYIRKLLGHGFSERSLREQEPILKEYVDILVHRLHKECQNGEKPVDIASWYNYLIFDFIGFLTFGETFNCLSSGTLHTWVGVFFGMAKTMSYKQMGSRMPYLLRVLFEHWFVPPGSMDVMRTLRSINDEKIRHRLQNNPQVPDFMDSLVEAFNSGKMSAQQLEGNAGFIISAGSETTATLLSGITWLLLKHPRVLEKLTREIRTRFNGPDEITISGLNECKYLLGCIEEALRVYPPSAQPHHRIIPPGGAFVNGEFLPAGTSVAIPIYAIANSRLNWTEPESFIPERWTGEDPRFASDKRESSQPFSYGPRNCLGRNLAYAEMKLVVARIVWHFDIENATEGDWMDQRVYMVWEKSPLFIKLRPVARGV
ncbi:averantin oxidoreductase [Nemania sp. FL0031]|nr:averantin oxidoreductase [Nemania sp. FL0031]